MSAQQVTVSKMNLMIYKNKKKSAQKGYDLLKKKLDALKKKMRDMQKVEVTRFFWKRKCF